MRKQGSKQLAFIISLFLLTVMTFLGITPAGAATPDQVEKLGSKLQSSRVDAVGGWSGVVWRDGVTDYISVAFQSGGKLCLITQDGSYSGAWSQTSSADITWSAVETLPGNTGLIYVNQRGSVSSSLLLTQGVTTIKDNEGNFLRSVKATVLLGRDSSVVSNCK